jgi:hypothetical protein
MTRRDLLGGAGTVILAPGAAAMAAASPPVVAPVRMNEAEALFSFMGWLTSRNEEVGPFSSHHDASRAAELVNEFCQSQGWEVADDYFAKKLRPFPQG